MSHKIWLASFSLSDKEVISLNKKFLKHYMETNPEGTAQTYIFMDYRNESQVTADIRWNDRITYDGT